MPAQAPVVALTDFLRATVLLCGAAATALAVASIAGARADDDMTLLYVALAWWTAAGGIGLWLGRRSSASAGIARLLSSARVSAVLPEPRPAAILLNRLWGLAMVTLIAGAFAFLIPQIPTVGAGYALAVALVLRKQPGAVAAIEGRDGARFYIERTSPFRPTRIVRAPGLRKLEGGAAEA